MKPKAGESQEIKALREELRLSELHRKWLKDRLVRREYEVLNMLKLIARSKVVTEGLEFRKMAEDMTPTKVSRKTLREAIDRWEREGR